MDSKEGTLRMFVLSISGFALAGRATGVLEDPAAHGADVVVA
jgi:hypothetical protein